MIKLIVKCALGIYVIWLISFYSYLHFSLPYGLFCKTYTAPDGCNSCFQKFGVHWDVFSLVFNPLGYHSGCTQLACSFLREEDIPSTKCLD